MAKLVIQNQGMTGRACELNTDRTTIGRVEDNTFQIADASVSSHHCEVHLRGSDVFIRDLNSTNGSFINGEKVTEQVLKPGQILRLGQGDDELGAIHFERQGAAALGDRAGNQTQRRLVDGDGLYVYVGDPREFGERNDQIFLRDDSTAQQQLAQMYELARLVLNSFIEVIRGDLIPLAENFT